MVPNCSLNCAKQCAAEALQVIGEEKALDEILDIIKKDAEYYRNSGGGVTLSGGEPLYQPKFLFRFLKRCKEENLHVVVETCGHVKWDCIKHVLPYVDLFYYDVKLLDNQHHEEYTRVTNNLILSNLRKLVENGYRNIVIRVPIIPTVNDNMTFLSDLAQFMKELSLKEAHLLPYHRLGEKKYEQLGFTYTLKNINPPDSESLEKLKAYLESHGLIVKIGG